MRRGIAENLCINVEIFSTRLINANQTPAPNASFYGFTKAHRDDRGVKTIRVLTLRNACAKLVTVR
jgi:hypothetical protein